MTRISVRVAECGTRLHSRLGKDTLISSPTHQSIFTELHCTLPRSTDINDKFASRQSSQPRHGVDEGRHEAKVKNTTQHHDHWQRPGTSRKVSRHVVCRPTQNQAAQQPHGLIGPVKAPIRRSRDEVREEVYLYELH